MSKGKERHAGEEEEVEEEDDEEEEAAFLTVSFFLDDVSGFLETASLTRRRHSAAPS